VVMSGGLVGVLLVVMSGNWSKSLVGGLVGSTVRSVGVGRMVGGILGSWSETVLNTSETAGRSTSQVLVGGDVGRPVSTSWW
jgi:hypothetical protein